MTNTCKNCNNKYTGNFCNQCGQKQTIGSFTFKHIMAEGLHAFTHADKSILSLVKNLVTDPGKVAYEYIVECKRKKYFNLFTFFLMITALSAFFASKDLAIKQAVFHDNNEYGQLFNVYSKLLTLATIPVLAFFLWLINIHKNRLRYSEYTVFAMILLSVSSIIDIAVNGINIFLTKVFKLYFTVDGNIFYALFIIAFIAYANFSFHKKLYKTPWLRSLLSGLAFCLVQVFIAMFIIWAFLRNFNGLGIFSMYGISNR
jgi:Protein of unknown function (DUF3667)